MARNTLRKLEDLRLGLRHQEKCGRIIFSVNTAGYLIELVIEQEKRLKELEKVLDKLQES